MPLNLDARQRAMLDEMGVRVFLPEVAGVAEGQRQPPSAMPTAPVRGRAVAPAPAVVRAADAAPVPAPVPAVVPAVSVTATNTPASQRDGLAQATWPALQQAVATCRACRLCESRRNTVFGVGGVASASEEAPPVDWLIVGEAPGENEDLQGEPFVGQAGRLLDLMLATMGLTRRPGADPAQRASVYIVNVLKCRPPMNRNPEPDEMAQCEPFLKRQIELLRPRIILAMGRFAIQTLLAPTVPGVHSAAVGSLRGKVHRYEGVPVVATYHPSYLLRSPHEKAKAWADLCLAQDVFEATDP